MVIQPCEKKHLTNMRASGSDFAIKLTPPRDLNIEQAIEWINDDELVEVAPAAIRVRKRTLDHSVRKVKAKTAARPAVARITPGRCAPLYCRRKVFTMKTAICLWYSGCPDSRSPPRIRP
jgi:hypothetical protein